MIKHGGLARSVVANGFALVVVLGITLGPTLGQPWWAGFRNYFPLDQLSYAGIATNVSQGNWALVEPHTLTGVSHYPSAWYFLIGAISGLTDIPVWVVWPILGITALSAGVLFVGATAARISGRWWAASLPALALLTGTFGQHLGIAWFTPLREHAVIWGPFGTAYVLNAEVAGLSLAAIAVCLLVRAAYEPGDRRTRRRIIWAGAVAGVTANVHTYSFLTVTLIAAVFLVANELLTRPQRAKIAIAVAAPIVVLLLGPVIVTSTGPLPLFVLLLLSLSPALVAGARRHAMTATAALAAFAVAASPQVVRTSLGILQGDPFLLYREGSTRDLGVIGLPVLLASTTWILALLACALALWGRRQPALGALTITLTIGFIVLPLNDLWGFNQEPYRFWLQLAVLGGLLVTIPLSWAMGHLRSAPRSRRIPLALILILTAIAWLAGLSDVAEFRQYARSVGVIPLSDDRSKAIRELMMERAGLTMAGQCMDPRAMKLITRGPVAEYNLGLAWPENEPAFRIFHDAGRRAGEDPTALLAAGVTWVLTDSACETEWQFPEDLRVVPVATQSYREGGTEHSLMLWMVSPG